MGDHQWRSRGRHHPRAVPDHSASLQTDFNNVLNTAESSLPRDSGLPSGFREKIAKGIRNGIGAHLNRHGFKWSEADKGSITKFILDNIMVETDGGTQGTIPLTHFYGLNNLIQGLHAKSMLICLLPQHIVVSIIQRERLHGTLRSSMVPKSLRSSRIQPPSISTSCTK